MFLDLADRTVVIVGGGNVAIEKLHSLMPSGAIIRVVSPNVSPEIEIWAREGRLTWVAKEFEDSDVDDAYMVIAATDDPQLNARVFCVGDSKLRLTNSVDDPAHCNFIMAAIAREGPMQVAVSSAGCSPALAQRVRKRIADEILTEELGEFAEFLGDWRPELKRRIQGYKNRQEFWERVVDSEIPRILRVEGRSAADAALRQMLDADGPARVGKVFLVGAGPGDPGLVTVRAAEELRRADVILYDRLVNPALLKYARGSAEKVYVGKEPGVHGGPRQVSIHEQLVHHARLGKRVVRLKGGDPFVFGRGGEEALALQEAGISYEVIPGVSSAIAAPAAARIPVTHRKIAPAFGVFAGQEADDATGDGIPWQAAALMPTAVFLMGVERLPHIVAKLIEHGRSADTPVAVVSNGTLPSQRSVTGTLADIADLAAGLEAPAAIVVGEVVRIGEILSAVFAEARVGETVG